MPKAAPAAKPHMQRPPAELRYADELAALAARDKHPRPAGWKLSMPAVREFILGSGRNSAAKLVCAPSLIERCLVTLASQRALLLVGEPGTAKSLLSELLAAAVSGDSTLTVQGSAATSEDQIRYGWNYALLLNHGPSPEALVPSPLMRAMREGRLVRFEEITRCPPEVQDGLLSILSERLLTIPELAGQDEAATVFAQSGFNLIATANIRDRGVNEMSAALKRRFAFETVFPIASFDEELALVQREVARLLAQDGLDVTPTPEVLDILVTLFRELRDGVSGDGQAAERLTTTLSTAEAVSVAHAVTLRGYYLHGHGGSPEDLADSLASAAVKDNPEDLQKLRRHIEQRAKRRSGAHWGAFYQARNRLA